jgi:hypothetical protein
MGNAQTYNQYVEEENRLLLTMETCEESAAALCHWVYKYGRKLDLALVTEFINHIVQRQNDLYTRLLLLRLKKSELAHIMDKANKELNM